MPEIQKYLNQHGGWSLFRTLSQIFLLFFVIPLLIKRKYQPRSYYCFMEQNSRKQRNPDEHKEFTSTVQHTTIIHHSCLNLFNTSVTTIIHNTIITLQPVLQAMLWVCRIFPYHKWVMPSTDRRTSWPSTARLKI